MEYVSPDLVKVGDIIACYAHDDQLENRNALVLDIERDDTPGVLRFKDNNGKEYAYPYEYQIWLSCRHLNRHGNLRKNDAQPYRWHRYPWNGVSRY